MDVWTVPGHLKLIKMIIGIYFFGKKNDGTLKMSINILLVEQYLRFWIDLSTCQQQTGESDVKR